MAVSDARDASAPSMGRGQALSGRALSGRALAVGVLAIAAQTWLLWPDVAYNGAWQFVLDSLLVPTLLISGAVLRSMPGQVRNGTLLLLTATGSLVQEFGYRDIGPLSLVGYTLGVLWVVPLAALLLRWPGERLTAGQRRLVITVAVVPLIARVIDSLTWDPVWGGYHGPAWWLTLVHDRPLHDRLVVPVGEGAMAVLAAVFLLFLWRRWRTVRGLDRLELAPIACAAVITAIGVGADAAGRALDVPTGLYDAIGVLISFAVLSIPISLVVIAFRRRLLRAQVADLVVRVSGREPDVRAALREALADPSLDVLFAVGDELLDGDGALVLPDPSRLVVPVLDTNDELVAAVVMDQSLSRHPQIVEAVVAAAGMAILNARLNAEVLARLSEVRASRRRIVEAGISERRRVERDLHDGAQQRLLALATTLGRARATTDEEHTLAVLDHAREQLRDALSELRNLARGVHPVLLTDAGLAAALDDVCRQLPMTVTLDVPALRWGTAVETTAYFVVCEALANAAKHSGCTQVAVSIGPTPDGHVVVDVTDDGVGGASDAGSGIRGIRDRVAALGGVLTVDSPAGAGTHVRASIPCA